MTSELEPATVFQHLILYSVGRNTFHHSGNVRVHLGNTGSCILSSKIDNGVVAIMQI